MVEEDSEVDEGSGPRRVTVAAVGKSAVVPDVVTISLGVQVRGSTAQDALGRTNDTTRSAIDAFKEGGVEQRDIATTNISIWPQYGDDGRRVEGYQAQNTLSVRIRELAEAGRLLDSVAGLVGDDVVIQGISFSVSDPEAALAEARTAAMAAARSKAEQLAAAAGAEVAEVLTIDETAGAGPPVGRLMARQKLAAEGVPIEAGEQELTVSVEVTYRLRG
jgi:uncharacterized protein YggE